MKSWTLWNARLWEIWREYISRPCSRALMRRLREYLIVFFTGVVVSADVYLKSFGTFSVLSPQNNLYNVNLTWPNLIWISLHHYVILDHWIRFWEFKIYFERNFKKTFMAKITFGGNDNLELVFACLFLQALACSDISRHRRWACLHPADTEVDQLWQEFPRSRSSRVLWSCAELVP